MKMMKCFQLLLELFCLRAFLEEEALEKRSHLYSEIFLAPQRNTVNGNFFIATRYQSVF